MDGQYYMDLVILLTNYTAYELIEFRVVYPVLMLELKVSCS